MVTAEPERVGARRRLGVELRSLREEAGLSGMALADELGWSQSKVSRIEAARTIATAEDVSALLDALKAPKSQRRKLLELATVSAGASTQRRNSTGSGLTRRQQDFIALEAAASSILHYQPVLLPGYMQTEAYARRVIEMAGDSNVDRALEHRMSRRATMTKPDAPQYRIVILETVLRWRPVVGEEMVKQLERVAEYASLPNVTLQVVSLNEQQSTYVQHPFMIFDVPGRAEALVETTTQDLKVVDDGAVERLRNYFEKLSSAAMSPNDSLAFFRTVVQSYLDRA